MKKALIIGFVFPEPQSSAAGNRMMQLIELFQSLGYSIYFGSTAQNMDFSEDLSKLGVEVISIELNDASFDAMLLALQPHVVLFDRFMMEEQYGWRIAQHCPNAIRILDTEDLHCLRQGRMKAVKENRDFHQNDLISDISKREIASILRCDSTLMVSTFEMDVLTSFYKVPKEILFYLPIFANKLDHVPTFDERSDFVFIGNFLHEPNWDAVRYLSESIWPNIQNALPHAKMRIYGSYASQKVTQLHKPSSNFYVEGRAKDAMEVIKHSRVMLAPLRFGAGIKGKLIESMQCGTPNVTTSIGAEGMRDDLSWNGIVADEVTDFVNAAIRLYQDETVWNPSQETGFALLESKFQRASYVTLFEFYFAAIIKDLQSHRSKNFMGLMLLHHTLASTKYMSKWIEEKNSKK